MKIKALNQETIEKIAAGEVIERPASVVKELVDNAVDAHATNITIEVWDKDRQELIISDDGHGMGADDLKLAVERHTTSKISRGEDLFALKTMGFRGEALASIAAISVLTITTRTADSVGGSRLVVKGGKKGEVEAAASPTGTKISVADLFFNTPARRKFLRKSSTEFSTISQAVQQQILAWPGIRFQLFHNGKKVLASPGTNSLTDAIASLAGTDIAENLLECTWDYEGYSLTGRIATPEYHRSNRNMQFFTVNRRPVHVPMLGSAVEKAFHTLLPVNRHPIAFLNLEVPTSEVDVNVHPTKKEVKFSDSSSVFRLVHRACVQALTAAINEEVKHARPPALSQTFTPRESIKREGKEIIPQITPKLASPRQSPPPIRQVRQLELDAVAPNHEPEFTILGQVFSSFIVVATPQELRLVDQHAAQERVRYEKFLKMVKSGQRPSQVTLPIETSLSGRMQQFVQVHLARLAELGFRIDLQDGGMVVKEVPILFRKALSGEDIIEIIDHLQESEGDEFDLGDYSQAAMMLLACKGAIKANHRLSTGEARQLLVELSRCDNSKTCPHGRPISVAFDRVNLEKMFARR